MIQHKTAILRVLFLFAVLTCTGITVYSIHQTNAYSVELSSGANSVENRLSSEVNASDDVQFYHHTGSALLEGLGSEIQVPQDCSIFLQRAFSVWQPPKIS
jgi:Ni,Fe-hydrogenase I cytochrome b subunit